MFCLTIIFVQWAVGNCDEGNYHVTDGFLNVGLALSAEAAVSLVSGQTYCVTIKVYNYAGVLPTFHSFMCTLTCLTYRRSFQSEDEPTGAH